MKKIHIKAIVLFVAGFSLTDIAILCGADYDRVESRFNWRGVKPRLRCKKCERSRLKYD